MSTGKIIGLLAAAALLSSCAVINSKVINSKNEKPLYTNPDAPVEKRVNELLAQMTTEEKTAQLGMLFLRANPKKLQQVYAFAEKGIGNIHDMTSIRSWPTKKASEFLDDIQKKIIEKSRLGIPAIISNEALHGLLSGDAVSYPQAIGLAATFDPELIEKIADAIGVECRARGDRQVLSPVVNIARDPRWGRVEETYGEDPFLTSAIGAAFCRGLEKRGIISTPKHFVANYGDGGRDSHAVNLSRLALGEIYFPGFEACIRQGGALSVMSSYNSLNGIPCTANHWLLTDILRNRFGFKGFVISDAGAVRMLMKKHHIAENGVQAAALALNAGVDVELTNNGTYLNGNLLEAVKSGLVPMENLDRAVRRVLRAKFAIGLFEHPYSDYNNPEYKEGLEQRKKLALEAAEKSIVLLKNSNNTLPLGNNIKTLAVIGPLAAKACLGGYSKKPENPMSLIQGLKQLKKNSLKIISETSLDNPKVLEAVKKSDAAVIVLGITENEGRDRCHLKLQPEKENLIKALAATGKPTVVVLYAGNAVVMTDWIDSAGAVLDAWYPGDLGGLAIAEILFGKVNPSGRLPITFPRFTGQIPLYYSYKPSGRGYNYADAPGTPLFPFGHGLSYTTFKYSNLKITPSPLPAGSEVTVSLDIENTGKYDGDEVIQIYIRDVLASMAQPLKKLTAFKRVSLKTGEKKHIEFKLTPQNLSFRDQSLNYRLEPGKFEIMTGPSSENILLKGQFRLMKMGPGQ